MQPKDSQTTNWLFLDAKKANKILRKSKNTRDKNKIMEHLLYHVRQSGYDCGFNSGVKVGREIP